MIETNCFYLFSNEEIELKKGKKNEYKISISDVLNINKHVVIYEIIDDTVHILNVLYVVSNAYIKLTNLTYSSKLSEYFYYDANQLESIKKIIQKNLTNMRINS